EVPRPAWHAGMIPCEAAGARQRRAGAPDRWATDCALGVPASRTASETGRQVRLVTLSHDPSAGPEVVQCPPRDWRVRSRRVRTLGTTRACWPECMLRP